MWIDAPLLRRALALPSPVPPFPQTPEARPTAVMVPVRLDGGPARVVLGLRARTLADHGGELGFPGGKPEPGDADLWATALREASEEVGVSPAEVERLGELSAIPVITGRFVVHPFVAQTPPLRVASPELERLIEVPLAPWLEGTWPIHGTMDTWHGATFFTPFFRLEGGETLYGASAAMVAELLVRLCQAAGRSMPEPVIVQEKPWGKRYEGLIS